MPRLAEIYVAARTRNVEDAGTSDLPVLLISRGADDVAELQLRGNGLGTGAAELYRLDVSDQALDSEGLVLRLVASGDDAWAPEHVIAWGISGGRPHEIVVPLGVALDLATPLTPGSGGTWLSTDRSEGAISLLLRTVGPGRRRTAARRLIVIAATDPYPNLFPASPGPGGDVEDRGTAGPVTLQAGGAGRLVLSYQLPNTPQGDLGRSAGAFYLPDLAAPFSRADLAGGAFTLTISSDDWWMPDYFAVFGVDTHFGQPTVLIPFVAASAFVLPQMSTDPSEGWHTTVLPTAQVPNDGFVVPPVSGNLGLSLNARMTPHPPVPPAPRPPRSSRTTRRPTKG